MSGGMGPQAGASDSATRPDGSRKLTDMGKSSSTLDPPLHVIRGELRVGVTTRTSTTATNLRQRLKTWRASRVSASADYQRVAELRLARGGGVQSKRQGQGRIIMALPNPGCRGENCQCLPGTASGRAKPGLGRGHGKGQHADASREAASEPCQSRRRPSNIAARATWS